MALSHLTLCHQQGMAGHGPVSSRTVPISKVRLGMALSHLALWHNQGMAALGPACACACARGGCAYTT